MLSDVYNQHYVTATRECITCTRESITCTRECITATREAIPEITTETTIEITPNNIPNIFLKEIPLASSSKKKEKDLIINNTSKLDIQNKIDKNKEKFDLFCLEHFKDEGKKVFDFFSGLTLYCNSKDKDYINLLEFYLKNSSKKEIMDFIRVYGPFQTECIELLGEKDGTFLAEFFTTFFSDAQKKNGLKKSMNNKDRLKNIKNLINLFGKEKLLACAHKFQDDEKQGRIRVHDYNYFVGAVEKFKIQGETKPTIEPEKKIIKSMKPVIFERITENYEMDFLNYSYKCECGTIHDGWAVECKKCGMIYDWH